MVSRWMKINICVTSSATFKDDDNVSSLWLLILSGDNWQANVHPAASCWTNKQTPQKLLLSPVLVLQTSCLLELCLLLAWTYRGEELLITWHWSTWSVLKSLHLYGNSPKINSLAGCHGNKQTPSHLHSHMLTNKLSDWTHRRLLPCFHSNHQSIPRFTCSPTDTCWSRLMDWQRDIINLRPCSPHWHPRLSVSV